MTLRISQVVRSDPSCGTCSGFSWNIELSEVKFYFAGY